jgi:hypothetical protein
MLPTPRGTLKTDGIMSAQVWLVREHLVDVPLVKAN